MIPMDAKKVISFARRYGGGRGKASVVLFLARKCSGLEALVALSREQDKRYEIVGALLTTRHSQAIPVLDRWQVPWSINDIYDFCSLHQAKVSDLGLRRDYDRRSLELITQFDPTHIALYGYVYILTNSVLKAFPGRIINLHDSDLTIRNQEGVPKFCGLHATRDTILAGERNTYSSVHVVTEEVDAGPMIARSHPYPVCSRILRDALKGDTNHSVKSYAYAQREWMMRDCWPSLMDEALEYLAERQALRESSRQEATQAPFG